MVTKSSATRILLRWSLVLIIMLVSLAAAGMALGADRQPPAGGPSALQDVDLWLPLVLNQQRPSAQAEYVLIGWNDLGMHCYDLDYATLSVLPPYNTMWAQLIRRGDPPELIAENVTVSYAFPDNKESASKTNFWDYDQELFGQDFPLNVGLKGKGLSGEMDPVAGENHFIAEGVPLTEFSDSAPTVPDYYQLAHLTATDGSGGLLAETTMVAPVSSEMRCFDCHNERDPNNFRRDILLAHDDEGETDPPLADQGTSVLCASCHADPALGMTGDPEVPSLSAAMHGAHAEETSDCYACHPGPQTQCLRDVMSQQFGLECVDCHVGGMQALANENRTPWIDEPRCGDAACHGSAYSEQPDTLYRFSTGHGGLYCEACHNSTHAILPSREANDNLQSISLQGYAGTLADCLVCHITQPDEAGGPHSQ